MRWGQTSWCEWGAVTKLKEEVASNLTSQWADLKNLSTHGLKRHSKVLFFFKGLKTVGCIIPFI